MVISETLYDHAGQPLGKIKQDLLAGWVTFEPKDGNKRLAARVWRSLNDCRKAVLRLYRRTKN